MRQIGRLMVAVVTVGAIACGGETSAPTRTDAALGETGGGTDTTGTPTSAGPVASVVITPKNATLRVGYYASFAAIPLDDKGVFVSGKKATWRSSDASVLVVSDTGLVFAKAVGSAKLYGTVDGHVDSANVTVLVAPPDTTINQPPPPAPVSTFNLTLTVAGTVAGADTSRTQPVAGATVTVTRVMGIRGDTLNPSVLAGTVTTDANGMASLSNLPGGSYTFVATPAAGSGYLVGSSGIGAPRVSDVRVGIVLRRAP